LHAIVTDWFKAEYAYMALAGLQNLLPRAVALHFCRRAVNPQQLKRKSKRLAVIE
jgi:hypothetical protein